MNEAQQIGFFQFDNLVRNRIPFVLLHEPVDFREIYESGMMLDFLEQHSHQLELDGPFEDIRVQLQRMKVDLRIPAIVMSASGPPNPDFISRLEEAGFVNVYGVEDGWEGLVRESKET